MSHTFCIADKSGTVNQGFSAPEGDQASFTVVTEKTQTPGKKGKFNIEDSMIGP